MLDFDLLWNYADPAATEIAFAALLPDAHTANDTDSLAQLLTQIARAQGLQRKFDQAHATLDEAQALIREGEDKATVRPRIRALLERGRVFNSSGQRDSSQPYFQQAFDLAIQVGEDFYAIDAAHMLAIVESAGRSLQWNERALALAESSHNAQARGWLGSLYNNIGWTYHDAGRHTDALGLFERALELRIANRRDERDDSGIRVAKWSIARTLRSLGHTERALATQRNLLAELDVVKERDGFVFEEIGECLLSLGQAEEAKLYFAQAHAELSKDEWFVANEPARLQRLKDYLS